MSTHARNTSMEFKEAVLHDGVVMWKLLEHNCPFVRGIICGFFPQSSSSKAGIFAFFILSITWIILRIHIHICILICNWHLAYCSVPMSFPSPTYKTVSISTPVPGASNPMVYPLTLISLLIWSICDTVQLVPIRFFWRRKGCGRMVNTLATAVGV